MIVRLQIRRVDWQVEAGGAARSAMTRSTLLIALHDLDGRVAFGEAAPLPGMSRDTIDDAHREIETLAATLPRPVDAEALRSPSARFAIDTALLGLEAIRRGVPIHALFDGHGDSLPLAAVVDTPTEAVRAIARGIATLKIKISKHCDPDRIAAIHRVAPAARLRLDANRAWSPERARKTLASLAYLPIDFIEEPCTTPYLDLPMPVALDESLAALGDEAIDRAIAHRNVAALILKPTLLGGFSRCLALAAKARDHGKQAIVTHCLEGPIGTAACAELALAIGGTAAVGLAPHTALAGWSVDVPQIQDSGLRSRAAPGLGISELPTRNR